jgi:hypothetical protein
LLVIGAYRDSELSTTGPLAIALADLRHEQPPEQVRLTGLGEIEVAELAQRWGVNVEVAPTIYAKTEGNALFAKQMLRHPAEFGDSSQRLGVPDGVKDVISRRVARLSDEWFGSSRSPR